MRRHVEIGEKVVEKIHLDKQQTMEREGTVIWIHPKGRLYRVRFECPRGKWKNVPGGYITESYLLARDKAD